MSEGLSLPGREALRTAMQWDDGPAGGFSTAAVDLLVRRAISRGRLGALKVNVRTQQRDPHSLLSWFDAMIATLRECPEIGVGVCLALEAIARLGVERLGVPLDPAAQRTPALMNLGLLIRWRIGLIVREIGID